MKLNKQSDKINFILKLIVDHFHLKLRFGFGSAKLIL